VLVPLALDTFVLAAALGLAGLEEARRVRTSATLAAFEAGMPIVGVLAGRGLGSALGQFAGYTAAVVIGLAGVLLLRPGDEDRERARLELLAHARGLAVIDLGLSISMDELAVGFGLGLLQVPLIFVVVYLGVQAFVAAQLGLWLGARLQAELREGAEWVAGGILIIVAIALLALKVMGKQR